MSEAGIPEIRLRRWMLRQAWLTAGRRGGPDLVQRADLLQRPGRALPRRAAGLPPGGGESAGSTGPGGNDSPGGGESPGTGPPGSGDSPNGGGGSDPDGRLSDRRRRWWRGVLTWAVRLTWTVQRWRRGMRSASAAERTPTGAQELDQLEEVRAERGQAERTQLEQTQLERPLPQQGQLEHGQPEQGQLEQGQPEQGQPEQGQPEQGQPVEGRPVEGRPELNRQRADTTAAPGPRPVPWLVVVGAAAGWLAVALVLYSCYLRLARTIPVNSDAAANELQAWAMLHGDPLLRGWVLSDVSFYTTELPQYMLIELVRGLTPDVTHIAAAITYSLLVVLAARLAKGGARGMLGLMRAGLAAGIMMAPPQSSGSVLLSQPDHVGSGVPVLLVLLLIDRAGRRWFVPPLVLVMVAWALVADQVILISLAGPLAFVGLARAYHLVARQKLARAAWFEIVLALATAGGVVAGERALRSIHEAGGFAVYPVSNQLAPVTDLAHDGVQVVQGVLVLFGADFAGRTVGWLAILGLTHLAGVAFACWGVGVALRRFWRATITIQILAISVTFSVVAYWLGPNSAPGGTSREFAAVLPLGAALAGRVLGRRLRQSRLGPALAVVLGVYAAGLVTYITRPAAPAQNQALANWLVARHMTYGLADYWLANSVTVDSGGRVAVRAVKASPVSAWAEVWEAKPGWYSAAQHVANFVVVPSYGPGPGRHAPSVATVVHWFGQPGRVYLLPEYTVLVWTSNLLTRLGPGSGPGPATAHSAATQRSRPVAVG